MTLCIPLYQKEINVLEILMDGMIKGYTKINHNILIEVESGTHELTIRYKAV